MSIMGDENERQFENWWARNHPLDWFTSSEGQPISTTARIRIWDLCKSAWLHKEPTEWRVTVSEEESR